MTLDEIVAALASIDATDAEFAHGRADELLLAALRATGQSAVADAYDAVQARAPFWAHA